MMTTTKLAGVALLALLSTGAQAGLFDSAMTADWPTKPTKKYKLDMYGYDARAYEFKSDNGLNCIAVFSGGTQGGFQMQCAATQK